jgi:tetratricopeptide (TPR) repeat protein
MDHEGLMEQARVAFNAGRVAEAEALLRRAVEARRLDKGEGHISTMASLSKLARCLRNQRRFTEAEQLYRQVLDVRRRVLGDRNADTLRSAHSLATCLHSQKRYADAEPLLQGVLEARRSVLGEEHADTLQSAGALAACTKALKAEEAAAAKPPATASDSPPAGAGAGEPRVCADAADEFERCSELRELLACRVKAALCAGGVNASARRRPSSVLGSGVLAGVGVEFRKQARAACGFGGKGF